MYIMKNDSKRTVSIWLTLDEQDNPLLMHELSALVDRYRQENLSPVIFRSGKEELYESAFMLLRHNKAAAISQK